MAMLVRLLLAAIVLLVLALGAMAFLGHQAPYLAEVAIIAPLLAGLIFFVSRIPKANEEISRQDAMLNLRCPRCGYDIRMQFKDDQSHCPECGSALDYGRWRHGEPPMIQESKEPSEDRRDD